MKFRITYKYHDDTVLSIVRSKEELGIYGSHKNFKCGSFSESNENAGAMINYLESYGLAKNTLDTWRIKRVTIRPDYVRSISV